MTCDTWFEKLKLESNTTPRFLISQNIDREVREELATNFLGVNKNELGFVWVEF